MKSPMKTPFSRSGLVQSTLLALMMLVLSPGAYADVDRHRTKLDVAMNGQTFFDFEENPGNPGVPPNGSPFIIQGYIYPGGTFSQFGALSGVNADGSPEFPNRVIGTWICRGWHLQDGDASTGPVVATTQIFTFGSKPGANTIVTDGIELADFEVTFKRAVTGGTGIFRRTEGEMWQTYVWDEPDFLNASGGFNTSFEFRLSASSQAINDLLKGTSGED